MNLLNLIKPIKVFAYELEGPGIKPTDDSPKQLESILSTVIGFLTVIAVLFFVIQIILAGYGFISGQGDEKKIEASRKKLTDSILGLTIVVIAFGLGAFIAKLLGLSDVFNLTTVVETLKLQ